MLNVTVMQCLQMLFEYFNKNVQAFFFFFSHNHTHRKDEQPFEDSNQLSSPFLHVISTVKEKTKYVSQSTFDLLKEYLLTPPWSKWVVIETQPLKEANGESYYLSSHLCYC